MSLKFASLGSGSKGNATLVQSIDSLVLIDCGFSVRETERRLRRLGCRAEDLTAILVTHEHSDHASGIAPLARRYNLPVYLTHGTHVELESRGIGGLPTVETIDVHRSFALGDLDITPVVVPHDAREPCQFVIRYRQKTLGILTDLGRITPHVVEAYQACDALVLECNHDVDMLQAGPYPPSLKKRVGGDWGHLNNRQAGSLLGQIRKSQLQHLVAAHISDKNNTPEMARAALLPEFETYEERLMTACQNEGFGWLSIE